MHLRRGIRGANGHRLRENESVSIESMMSGWWAGLEEVGEFVQVGLRKTLGVRGASRLPVLGAGGKLQ